jgi:hypothetical protein
MIFDIIAIIANGIPNIIKKGEDIINCNIGIILFIVYPLRIIKGIIPIIRPLIPFLN